MEITRVYLRFSCGFCSVEADVKKLNILKYVTMSDTWVKSMFPDDYKLTDKVY